MLPGLASVPKVLNRWVFWSSGTKSDVQRWIVKLCIPWEQHECIMIKNTTFYNKDHFICMLLAFCWCRLLLQHGSDFMYVHTYKVKKPLFKNCAVARHGGCNHAVCQSCNQFSINAPSMLIRQVWEMRFLLKNEYLSSAKSFQKYWVASTCYFNDFK